MYVVVPDVTALRITGRVEVVVGELGGVVARGVAATEDGSETPVADELVSAKTSAVPARAKAPARTSPDRTHLTRVRVAAARSSGPAPSFSGMPQMAYITSFSPFHGDVRER